MREILEKRRRKKKIIVKKRVVLSEVEDQEKASESEGVDEESEEESENMNEEFECSITIENTVIAPSEEAGGKKRTQEPRPLLSPFTGEEEVSSDEDDMPLSGIGKKPKKNPVKAIKSAIPTRKEVAPSARTSLTRSKRKAVDEQIIKESRGAKKPRKKVSIMEPLVESDGEDESESALPESPLHKRERLPKLQKLLPHLQGPVEERRERICQL
ncbi:PREDICTED: uncharacterized protein DDB_G0286299-like [Nicotiana attenuata]|uniref:uncharacterized protein DDB_G0286299-like n=1 Tax=Nicotiana attenuata TaxID=49451 RepID=UPI000905AF93|nr:PREDICTED: uncharacterized protein DDB_G0286299-like [Nicotiana attenuata]